MITASDFTAGIKVIPSDTINIPGPESKYNGVSTAVASSKLTDSGGAFLQVVIQAYPVVGFLVAT